ncbi:MAG TPA: S8 family serine peptidase [Gemmatimonadaceae bacterium]|nr:S8 family serine peptidase [Gemmatimonadaceae bacterium]
MTNSTLRSHRALGAPAVRWASVLTAFAIAMQLAACNDRMPLAPAEKQVANVPLPPAHSYIVQVGSAGQIPQAVQQAIHDAGGHIVRVQQDLGLALVTGMSASAANALRTSGAVGMILPNVRRQYVREVASQRHVVRLDAAAASRVAAHRLTALDNVDPRTAHFFGQQWNMVQIAADTAWQVTTQGQGVTVYILDTGVDTAHIDLAGKVDGTLSTSFAFAPGDTVDTLPLPFGHDVAGHGTFVSSQIAGNSLGMAAAAPQSRLVMVRVLDDNGSGDDFAVISGILYAADHSASIISVSLGGYLSRSNSFDLGLYDLMQRAIDYAAARGALIVAAAGNESLNTNTAAAPKGSYADSLHVIAGGLRHVISVGATGPVDQKNFDMIAQYSNFGKADVAVFAPGGNVVDTTDVGVNDLVFGACSSSSDLVSCPDENFYVLEAGTSFSAPLVAAEAAVIMAHATSRPTPAQLESCILNSADVVKGTSRPDINYNFGRIDVLAGALHSACK